MGTFGEMILVGVVARKRDVAIYLRSLIKVYKSHLAKGNLDGTINYEMIAMGSSLL